MISFSKKHRSTQQEIMDNLEFQGEEMKNLLIDLKIVNKWLGGNSITIDGVKKLLKNHSKEEKVTIVDIGCGDGEMLRRISDFGIKNNYNFECLGIDFNENILRTAIDQSSNYQNITYKNANILNDNQAIPNCDIILCTLFLHHFSNELINSLLQNFTEKSRLGIVINDLERSKQAFNLFKLAHKILLKTNTSRHDGLVSIARGFKRNELLRFSERLPNQLSKIRWCWAYRFQWIIKK